MDEPRDERPFYDQRCFLSAMLIIAAASRDFWISRLERLHTLPSSGTQNGSATTRRFLWAGSPQLIAYRHPRATILLTEHNVALLYLHRPAACMCRAVAHGNGLAEFGGGEYDRCRALLGAIFSTASAIRARSDRPKLWWGHPAMTLALA
jgi:hypothetical protein